MEQLLMELKYFFHKGIATLPARLVNNDLKIPPDWIISEIWTLESFKSIGILLLHVFLSFVLCLVVNNNSRSRLFSSKISKLILKVIPVLFLTTVFNFLSCLSDNFTFALLLFTLLFLCKILTQFLLIVRE